MLVEIEERRHITILADHPDGEFGRVHPVKVTYDVVVKTCENPHGVVVASGLSKRKAHIMRQQMLAENAARRRGQLTLRNGGVRNDY